MTRRVYTHDEYIGLVMESGQVVGVCPWALQGVITLLILKYSVIAFYVAAKHFSFVSFSSNIIFRQNTTALLITVDDSLFKVSVLDLKFITKILERYR